MRKKNVSFGFKLSQRLYIACVMNDIFVLQWENRMVGIDDASKLMIYISVIFARRSDHPHIIIIICYAENMSWVI